MLQQIVVNALIMLKESLKQLVIMHSVQNAASLSNWMHTQHWNTDVNGFDACSTW